MVCAQENRINNIKWQLRQQLHQELKGGNSQVAQWLNLELSLQRPGFSPWAGNHPACHVTQPKRKIIIVIF